MAYDKNKEHVDSQEVINPVNLDHLPKVEGYDFEKGFNFNKFIESYKSTGFQGTHFGAAVDIVNQMRKDNAFIFLSCTSNIVSSGLREIIKFLVKNKHIDFIVTSAGAIEEDIIKSMNPFHIGVFDVKGKMLFDRGVARIGNIFVPIDRYTYFEKFTDKLFPKLYKEQKKLKRPLCSYEIIKMMGKEINSEDSILYWAYKNKIPVICPAIMDGAFGDLMHYFKNNHKDMAIDVTEDTQKIIKAVEFAEKTGIIALGGGTSKHFVLNANIFRDGVDYAVYITTAQTYDGSDSGGNTEEAITWAKIKPDARHVIVNSDATLTFPMLVAATFAKKKQ